MSLIRLKPGWKKLEGDAAWSAELRTLIEEAQAAVAQDSSERLKIAAHAAGFIQESYPQTDEVDRLDDLALDLATDILLLDVDDRLAAIAERTAEWVMVEKEIANAAEEEERTAESLRLIRIGEVIDTATEIIDSAKELTESLDDSKASDQKIAGLIKDAVASVEKLKKAVEKIS